MDQLETRSSIEEMLVIRATQSNTPIYGILELLPLCNMNCDMCFVRLSKGEMDEKGGMLPGSQWLEWGKQMAQEGTLFVLLTGGEPLLHPDFKEIYLGLKKLGMIITVNTNGTLIDEAWADFFGAYKPRRINVTLYGAGEDTYSSLCKYPAGFSKTVEGIRLLRERSVDVKLNGSITPANVNDVEKMIQISHDLDVPYKFDTYMYPSCRERSRPFDQQARLSPEEAAAVRIRIMREDKDDAQFRLHAKKLMESALRPMQIPKQGIPCRAGKSSFQINWQGQLRLCVMVDRPSVSVFDGGFKKAWNQIVSDTANICLSGKCVQCDLRGACQVCAACALSETGDYAGTPEYMCRYTRESIRLLQELLK